MLKKADEFSFNALGFCAQKLTHMRHFQELMKEEKEEQTSKDEQSKT